MRFRRSSVAASKRLAARLNSVELPAATTIQPCGRACCPNVLNCRNCSMAGASVSDTQFASSSSKTPCAMPVRLMLSCTDAMISLMVYSETVYVLPSYLRSTRRGSPSALWRVWCVMEYDRKLMPHSWAACFTMAVLPTPGGPSRNIGRCISNGMRYAPLSWRERYAVMVSLTCCFADSISIGACLSPLRAPRRGVLRFRSLRAVPRRVPACWALRCVSCLRSLRATPPWRCVAFPRPFPFTCF